MEAAEDIFYCMANLAPMLGKVMPSVVNVSVEGSTLVKSLQVPINSSNSSGKIRHRTRTDSPF